MLIDRSNKSARRYAIELHSMVFLALLAVSIVVAGVGPHTAQVVAFVVAVIVLLTLLGNSLPLGVRGGRTPKSLAERQAEFHPQSRDAADDAAPLSGQGQAALWQRERERYRDR